MFHPWFRVLYRVAAGALLLLPAFLLAPAQTHTSTSHETHHYDLADPTLARAAQRYDWAQEGKGNRAELEKLVADDYVLFRASGKVTNKAGLIALVCDPHGYTNPYTVESPFVRDLGDTVILGGWVNLTGSYNGKPFQQKARFADIWHKGRRAGSSRLPRSPSPTIHDRSSFGVRNRQSIAPDEEASKVNMTTPKTGNIIESCLYVADVDRAAEWYGQIFGFPIIFHEGHRLRVLQVGQEQFLLLFKERGSLSPAVLPGGMIPAHDASGPAHIAFSMRTAEADQWENHLSAHQVKIESVVNWGEGDKSFYFRDPDNHVLELISHHHWQKIAAR